MKKLIIASLLAAVSFSAAAKRHNDSYQCDSIVVNMVSGQQGTWLINSTKVAHKGDSYFVTLGVGSGAERTFSFLDFTLSSKTPLNLPNDYVHSENSTDAFDLVPNEKGAMIFITDTTGSGNQLRLSCTFAGEKQ